MTGKVNCETCKDGDWWASCSENQVAWDWISSGEIPESIWSILPLLTNPLRSTDPDFDGAVPFNRLKNLSNHHEDATLPLSIVTPVCVRDPISTVFEPVSTILLPVSVIVYVGWVRLYHRDDRWSIHQDETVLASTDQVIGDTDPVNCCHRQPVDEDIVEPEDIIFPLSITVHGWRVPVDTEDFHHNISSIFCHQERLSIFHEITEFPVNTDHESITAQVWTDHVTTEEDFQPKRSNIFWPRLNEWVISIVCSAWTWTNSQERSSFGKV